MEAAEATIVQPERPERPLNACPTTLTTIDQSIKQYGENITLFNDLTPLGNFYGEWNDLYLNLFWKICKRIRQMSFLLKLTSWDGARSSPTFLSKKCFNVFFLFVYFSGINFVCCLSDDIIFFLNFLSVVLFFKKNVINGMWSF